jgi:hypothetical protein
MASGATGYVLHRTQVILLFQIISQRHLAEVILAVPLHRVVFGRLLVRHIENFFLGPQELLRLAMAIKAPFHLQRVLFIHKRHLVYGAMTAVTTDTLGNMNAVIEINKIGEIVHSVPLNRLACAEAGPKRLQHICAGPHLRVAVHAGLGWWNSGKTRFLYRCMTITAIKTQAGNMVLMTERDGLVRSNVLIGHIGRALQLKQRGARRGQQKDHSQNAGSGQSVCTAVKKLCHGSYVRKQSTSSAVKSACGQQPPFASRSEFVTKTDDYK